MRTSIWSVKVGNDEYLFSHYLKARAFHLENDESELSAFEDECIEMPDGSLEKRTEMIDLEV